MQKYTAVKDLDILRPFNSPDSLEAKSKNDGGHGEKKLGKLVIAGGRYVHKRIQ
jgi:hypothetical protein